MYIANDEKAAGNAAPAGYTVKRSDRKTAAIYLLPDGSVEVRAPLHMSDADIGQIVEGHRRWIDTHSERLAGRRESRERFALTYESTLPLLGAGRRIEVREGSRVGYDTGGECFFMPPGLDSDGLKAAAVQVYKLLARRILTEKTTLFAKQTGITPAGVRINSAKGRYGSCSGRGMINYSWMLVMADERAVDYVVVHELSHILEHNHSQCFWNTVKRFMPDYEERKILLDTLTQTLACQKWD